MPESIEIRFSFHSSNESKTSSWTGSVGGRGVKQHIGGSGGFNTRAERALKGSLNDVGTAKAGDARINATRAWGSSGNILAWRTSRIDSRINYGRQQDGLKLDPVATYELKGTNIGRDGPIYVSEPNKRSRPN